MYNFINGLHVKKGSRNIPTNLVRGTPPEKPCVAKTFALFSQPYLDTYNKCYKNIVVVNLMPDGPLADLVRFTNFPPLSEFKTHGSCSPLKQCGYALMTLGGCNMGHGSLRCGEDLMIVDEVPDLISYLVMNGYSVDTSITKMFNASDIRFDTNLGNKLICFSTYNG